MDSREDLGTKSVFRFGIRVKTNLFLDLTEGPLHYKFVSNRGLTGEIFTPRIPSTNRTYGETHGKQVAETSWQIIERDRTLCHKRYVIRDLPCYIHGFR